MTSMSSMPDGAARVVGKVCIEEKAKLKDRARPPENFDNTAPVLCLNCPLPSLSCALSCTLPVLCSVCPLLSEKLVNFAPP
jgi:hypothetical protein